METIKDKPREYKSFDEKIVDIDEKGIITLYPVVFNVPDRDRDIIEPGSATKTINENFGEIQHYINHNPDIVPGVPISMTPDDYGIKTMTKLMLNTDQGKWAYEFYKTSAEVGRSVRHSIGYVAIKAEKQAGIRRLKEIFISEFSTLTKMASNPYTYTVNVKSFFDDYGIDELIKEEKFYSQLLNCQFKDIELEKIEALKNHISALIENSRETTIKNEPQKIDWLKVVSNINH